MPLIRNLEGFPFGIRQPKDSGWCIPVSIEVVTKYHVPNSTMTQQQIVNAFVNYTKWPIESIGLKSIKEVMEHDSEFSWAEKQYFEDFEFHGFNGLALTFWKNAWMKVSRPSYPYLYHFQRKVGWLAHECHSWLRRKFLSYLRSKPRLSDSLA